MKFDFDRVTERRGTDSIKYDFAKERGKPEGLLPMWIADMDFPAPPLVLADIQKTVSHGIFGYTDVKDDYYDALAGWFQGRLGYRITREEVVKTPGVVFALACAIRAYTKPGDAVMVQTPVYYPFYNVIRDNGRELVKNPLACRDGRYSVDFEDFERKVSEREVKLFILCSPHNPVGRVWSREELEAMNAICENHGVIVVSDEIHCDLVWPGHSHTVFGGINENAVICTAPSKTFNLAGLQASNIFVKNAELRRLLELEISRSGYSQLNTIALAACKSAYRHGGAWLDALKAYLAKNIDFVRSFLPEKMPQVKLVEPEGTYLLWLDFRELGLSPNALDSLIAEKAGLWLSAGTTFGDEGAGFQRVNIACPKAMLDAAFARLAKAVCG
ncbi:MAG: pyridoxal phosphate-dependent aminotransferase [Spirochaetes bacterium]|nr:pyridoxal phosphate-dependent aminotransferase [Spirochaetota bacterium]